MSKTISVADVIGRIERLKVDAETRNARADAQRFSNTFDFAEEAAKCDRWEEVQHACVASSL